MDIRGWITKMAMKRQKRKYSFGKIPKKFFNEVKKLNEEDYFNFYCRNCGNQTNDIGICSECGGQLQKTRR